MSKNWTEDLRQNARTFTTNLKKRGYSFFTGVPCSLLGALIDHLENSPEFRYVANVREDAALGLASGAYLAGQKSCVLMQNSGFGYSMNVLTSLNMIYKIPILVVISYRGYLGNDAPEHIIMGDKIEKLLADLEIPTFIPTPDNLEKQIELADAVIEKEKVPVVMLIKEKIFG
ncbi:MAG: sulfopyruvate decarboxylase subunit alpha [Candidatus Omnitrophica bacterium]|nr:sulfopyruvate decarboxylase subunit alpha [Candidatus Omnitrophota bacterium]